MDITYLKEPKKNKEDKNIYDSLQASPLSANFSKLLHRNCFNTTNCNLKITCHGFI